MIIFFILFFFIFNSNGVYARDFLSSYVLELSPGYSSSYLCLNKGELINKRGDKISLAEKFDLAREKVLDSNSDEGLYDFIQTAFFSPDSPEWVGKCDQRSSAATDPLIEDILKKNQNLNCGGIYFKKGELRELFSAFYPVVDKSKDNYALSSLSLGVDEKTDNAYYDILDAIGFADLSAHHFLSIMYKGLSEGKRVVLNTYSRREIWYQPVFKLENLSQTITNENAEYFPVFNIVDFNLKDEEEDDGEISYSDYKLISDSMKNYKGVSFFFEGEGPRIQQNLVRIEEIDLALMKLFSAGVYPNTDPYFILKTYKMEEYPFPPFSDDILNTASKFLDSAPDLVSKLIKEKEEIFKETIRLGLKLKSKFTMYEIKSDITYSDELEFAQDYFWQDSHRKDYDYSNGLIPFSKINYSFYIVKNRETGEIYSRWKERNVGEKIRPGNIFISNSIAKEVLIKGPSYLKELPRLKKIYLELSPGERGLNYKIYSKILKAGLFDLLRLYDKCMKD